MDDPRHRRFDEPTNDAEIVESTSRPPAADFEPGGKSADAVDGGETVSNGSETDSSGADLPEDIIVADSPSDTEANMAASESNIAAAAGSTLVTGRPFKRIAGISNIASPSGSRQPPRPSSARKPLKNPGTGKKSGNATKDDSSMREVQSQDYENYLFHNTLNIS